MWKSISRKCTLVCFFNTCIFAFPDAVKRMNMALPLQISAYCFCCDCLVEADCLLSAAALHCEDNQCTIRVKGNALQRRPDGEVACTVHTAVSCVVRCRQLQCVLRCVRHGVTQDRSRWIGPRLSTFSKMVHIPTNTDPILTSATMEYGYSILAKYSSETFELFSFSYD